MSMKYLLALATFVFIGCSKDENKNGLEVSEVYTGLVAVTYQGDTREYPNASVYVTKVGSDSIFAVQRIAIPHASGVDSSYSYRRFGAIVDSDGNFTVTEFPDTASCDCHNNGTGTITKSSLQYSIASEFVFGTVTTFDFTGTAQ